MLGFDDDERDFGLAVSILKNMGISKINLLTNNPEKIKIITENGISIKKVTSVLSSPNIHNKNYLDTKRDKMGHSIALSKKNNSTI